MKAYYDFTVRKFLIDRPEMILHGYDPYNHRTLMNEPILTLWSSEEQLSGGRLAQFRRAKRAHEIALRRPPDVRVLHPYIEWLAEHAHAPWSFQFDLDVTLNSGFTSFVYPDKTLLFSFDSDTTAVFFKLAFG